MRGALGLAACLSLGCDDRTLPPYGQVQLTVSTDAPVPEVVSRLRVDVYSDGRWIDSRDTPRRFGSDWPASFTVVTESRARRVLVRVRLYREGALRDYRGERYLPPPPASAAPDLEPAPLPGDGTPRLVRGGVDVTPLSEPIPESAIDRLISLELREGDVQNLSLHLAIECAGTMADLRGERTCVDARNVLVAASAVPAAPTGKPQWVSRLAADLASLPEPRPGRTAVDGTPLFDEERRVPGGAFVLGSRAESAQGIDPVHVTNTFPERVFVAPPLLVDRYEVTVGRYRDALRRGLVVPEPPTENPGRLTGAIDNSSCTFSAAPLSGSDSRETMPLNCVSIESARAFCRFEGSDLPTELEWEWLATAADRPRKTSYPWGEARPTCDSAVFGRSPIAGFVACPGQPGGPLPVDRQGLDVTPSGVIGLAGNVIEAVGDPSLPYTRACWASAPLYAPAPCVLAGPRLARGGAWTAYDVAPSARRISFGGGLAVDMGFRCVRRR